MTQDERTRAAEAWLEYWKPGVGLEDREANAWVTDLEYSLLYEDPEDLWRLILEIHRRDHSNKTQEVLSAGNLENLLDKYGDAFIERVEAEARADPLFASLLGGVWKSSMGEAIWNRVQAVWDRRGWDGAPRLR
jgi:hypothetical protein